MKDSGRLNDIAFQFAVILGIQMGGGLERSGILNEVDLNQQRL